MPSGRTPLSPKTQLAALHRASVGGGLVTAKEASEALGISARAATSRLAALTRSGWLTRVRRGVYLILPVEAASGELTTAAEPWTMASVLYDPCYIGGWSAAEHWGLTEQLFRSTFVATTAHIRKRDEVHLGARFHLVRIKPERLHGLAVVWRASVRVRISGAERTVIDAAVNPAWIGGGRQLAAVLTAYAERPDASQGNLVSELERHGTGAAAKRLGFLAERLWPDASDLISKCRALKTQGLSKLDPFVESRGRLVTRWSLWANVRIDEAARS